MSTIGRRSFMSLVLGSTVGFGRARAPRQRASPRGALRASPPPRAAVRRPRDRRGGQHHHRAAWRSEPAVGGFRAEWRACVDAGRRHRAQRAAEQRRSGQAHHGPVLRLAERTPPSGTGRHRGQRQVACRRQHRRCVPHSRLRHAGCVLARSGRRPPAPSAAPRRCPPRRPRSA